MFRLLKISILLTLMVVAFQAGKLWQDQVSLEEGLVRLHVVANSDDAADQSLKQQVKDGIVEYLTPYMQDFDSQEDALTFLGQNLEQIRLIGERIVDEAGAKYPVFVELTEESFDTREYDTFSLPAGVYQTLCIKIGDGDGKNWWCVAFPALCVPVNTKEFSDVAVSAGFNEELVATISKESGYELRFYFLDQLGKLENLFH